MRIRNKKEDCFLAWKGWIVVLRDAGVGWGSILHSRCFRRKKWKRSVLLTSSMSGKWEWFDSMEVTRLVLDVKVWSSENKEWRSDEDLIFLKPSWYHFLPFETSFFLVCHAWSIISLSPVVLSASFYSLYVYWASILLQTSSASIAKHSGRIAGYSNIFKRYMTPSAMIFPLQASH